MKHLTLIYVEPPKKKKEPPVKKEKKEPPAKKTRKLTPPKLPSPKPPTPPKVSLHVTCTFMIYVTYAAITQACVSQRALTFGNSLGKLKVKYTPFHFTVKLKD